MRIKNEIRKGLKVTYVTPFKEENGVVKRVCEEDDAAFVVYHCNNDWNNYENYTAAKTSFKDLKLGWDRKF